MPVKVYPLDPPLLEDQTVVDSTDVRYKEHLQKVLVFRMYTGGRPPSPRQPRQPQPQPAYNPQKHGSLAQWVAPAITLIIGIISVSFMVHFRNADTAAKSSDEHTNALIDAKFNPAIDEINNHINSKVDQLSGKIDDLAAKVNDAEGQLKRLRGSPNTQNGKRQLTAIREGIETARRKRVMVPPAQLADYKNAIRVIPQSAAEYWTTVAAIINYQSFINQMNGQAPDPSKVSRPCPALTNEGSLHNFGNTFVGIAPISNCVVDLDTQTFADLTFKDSVVRYHGGKTTLRNITFINCTFVLDLSSLKTSPEKPALLFALLDSPDQKTVRIE